jgi:short-subunit dehydrogenase
MRSILILGGASDIGVALAKNYLSLDYQVLLAGRHTSRLQLIKNDLEIRVEGGKIRTIQFDAELLDSHTDFVDKLDRLPDITVCVFGYLGDQLTAKADYKECLRIINVNYSGAVNLLNQISERYKKRQKGTIVGISSVAGDRGRMSNYIYGSAKAGFTTYLSGLRNELYHHNVHVVTVKPGFVNTKMTSHLELPPMLTAQPQQVARAIVKAVNGSKNTIYVLSIWRMIMLVIKNIPEPIFKRLKL